MNVKVKGLKMDDISTLIKEAKPLYYKRKVRAKKIKTFVVLAFLMLSVSLSAVGGYNFRNYESNEYIASVSFEDDFYPLDSYGLITVEY